MNYSVTAIIPTIGRPDSLRRLLDSLSRQTTPLHEIIIADASSTSDTAQLLADWAGTPSSASQYRPPSINRVAIHPPNAVRQRQAAIALATGSHLLLLDDDVVLEPDCVRELLAVIRAQPDLVAAVADYRNQPWPRPTRLWRLYLRHVLRLPDAAWQGRVLGPLLRFGYHPAPPRPSPMQWLGTCNSIVSRAAYLRAGGFSDFFLHRCTMNEDVDLGLKLSKLGPIALCPKARLSHHHAPAGRLPVSLVAEDDLYNRFAVLHQTLGKSKVRALGLVLLFCAVETLSNIYHSIRRLDFKLVLLPLSGRTRALFRIAIQIGSSRPLKNAPGEGTGPTGL